MTAKLSICHYTLWHLYFVHLKSRALARLHSCALVGVLCSPSLSHTHTQHSSLILRLVLLYFFFSNLLAAYFLCSVCVYGVERSRLSAPNQYSIPTCWGFFVSSCIFKWLLVFRDDKRSFIPSRHRAVCIFVRTIAHIFANRMIYTLIIFANKSQKRRMPSSIEAISASIRSDPNRSVITLEFLRTTTKTKCIIPLWLIYLGESELKLCGDGFN